MSHSRSTERYHALDALRATALLFGLVLHAGLSFCFPKDAWPGHDWSQSTTLDIVLFVIHGFRMQVFFLLAGFFARMLYQRQGALAFARDRMNRIVLPLLASWLIVGTLTRFAWNWGMLARGTALEATIDGYLSGAALPGGAAFSLYHFWFLYYLLLFYVAALAAQSLLERFDVSGDLRIQAINIFRSLLHHPLGMLPLAIPLALSIYLCKSIYFGIDTPRFSLIPEWPALLGYAPFFAFGWMLERLPDLLDVWRNRWPAYLIAGLSSICALYAIAREHSLTAAVASLGGEGAAYSIGYGISMLLLVAGVTGLFLCHMNFHSPNLRYLADSSYWIYLMHLPLILFMQVWLGDLHLHWTFKFPLYILASTTVLLVSYHYFVRSTFIGAFLNGRRCPLPAKAQPNRTAAGSLSPVSLSS